MLALCETPGARLLNFFFFGQVEKEEKSNICECHVAAQTGGTFGALRYPSFVSEALWYSLMDVLAS